MDLAKAVIQLGHTEFLLFIKSEYHKFDKDDREWVKEWFFVDYVLTPGNLVSDTEKTFFRYGHYLAWKARGIGL